MNTREPARASAHAPPPAQPSPAHFTVVWPVLGALVLITALFVLLPGYLRAGPGLILPGLLALLIAVLVALVVSERWNASRTLTLVVVGFTSISVTISAVLLVNELSRHRMSPREMLLDAGLIWAINVLVFAVWYWEIDCGGPRARHAQGYRAVDFVFPQFSADDPKLGEGWTPNMVDYLYLAFNTSTAFSPTDTMVLSRRAKLLMMWQSAVSLIVVAVLLARAIGSL